MPRLVAEQKSGRPSFAGGAAALAVVSCMLLTGCAGHVPLPPAAMPGRPAVEQARLERGFQVYRRECGACHGFVDPAKYTADELRQEVMGDMGRKSGLTDAERDEVLAYLLAARKGK